MSVEKLTPYDWQEDIIERMLAEPTRAVLLASEQDTGKTVVASEFLTRRRDLKRVLIAGVKDTYAQWRDRLAAQSDGAILLRRIDSSAPGKKAFADLLAGVDGYYFSGHQYLASKDWTRVPDEFDPKKSKRKHLRVYAKMRPLDVLISDESHIHANRTSNGIDTMRSIPTDWRLALSGTPAGNRFENMHTLARWLWKDAKNTDGEYVVEPSIGQWRERWAVTEQKYVGRDRPVTIVTGEKEPGAFVATLPCYIRVESPSGDVPPPQKLFIDLSAEERAAYEQMENEGVMWLEAHPGLEPVVANLNATKRIRLRTAALGTMSLKYTGALDEDGMPDYEVYFDESTKSTKMQALKQILDHEEWAGRQVVIFTHSRRFAEVVAARMERAGYPTALWTGAVSSSKRDAIKAAFLAGEIRYIVAVVEALSTGYDGLQKVCNRVVWLSRSDDPTQNAQAARRIWRTGGDLQDYRSVEILARGTFDEGVFDTTAAKERLMKLTLAAA